VAAPSVKRGGPSPKAPGTGVRSTLARSLLILGSGSGSMTPDVERRLRLAFADSLVLEFDPKRDFREHIAADARVVVAGGDGTVGYVCRALIDSRHDLGIIPLGTYNNFARSLGLPAQLGPAIRVARAGVPHNITVGRVNGTAFLEAAAIGMFGAAIDFGEAIKDHAFGELGRKLAVITGAKPFRYEVTGDFEAHGTALSLVFANTPSTGAAMAVGEATPVDRHLELAVHAGSSRHDIIGRLLSGKMPVARDRPLEMGFRFRKITVTTRPMVQVYADNQKAGRTPVTISAESGALRVLLPRRRKGRAKPG
jgi:diacylglycerol kinase (ATP)